MNTTNHGLVPTFHRVDPGPPFRLPVRDREFLAGPMSENFPESVPDIGEMIPILAAGRTKYPPSVLAAAISPHPACT